MKKFAISVSTLGLFALVVVPALAANNCTNDTTGPYSTNYCDIENKSTVSVENNNEATIKNHVTGDVNTGNNSASMNTLGGEVMTGDATGDVTLTNLANVNTTTVTGGGMGGANLGANDTTGPFSDNRVDITNKQRVDVANNNDAYVKNHVDVTSDTGNNEADKNTGPGYVRTGDAWADVDVKTHVNDNMTAISAGAAGVGNNMATNDITGPFSDNYVTIKNRSNIDVDNSNDARVKNWMDVASFSGDNDANKNTLGGEIITGDAVAGVRINNEGNINTSRVMAAMGGFSNVAGTSISGSGSDDRATITNRQSTDVNNWNDANIWNHSDVISDTGANDANKNTAGGYVRSGMADMWQTVLTHFNDSLNEIK